jgi:hypothetical protein
VYTQNEFSTSTENALEISKWLTSSLKMYSLWLDFSRASMPVMGVRNS